MACCGYARTVALPRTNYRSRASGVSARVHRRAPGEQPLEAIAAVMRGAGMETAQRRVARCGVPRFAADAAAGRSDRVTGGAPPDPRAAPQRAPTAGSGVDRHHADPGAVRRTGAGRTGTGAAHGRRRAVQQPDGTPSLSGLRTAG